MSKEAMRAAVEALEKLAYADDFGGSETRWRDALAECRVALSLLRAELEARGEADDVFWVYELTKGEGVYQGVRGPNAESVLRQCVSGIDEAGEPFPLYASPVAADTQETDKRLLWLGQVRDDFRLMAEEASRYLTQHCRAVTQQAEELK